VVSVDLRGRNDLGGFELRPIFGNLTSLETLMLSATMLSGTIPATLCNTSLVNLWLFNTQLSGTLPFDLFNGLANLKFLDVSQTHIEGTIPTSLGKLTNLTQLELSNTNIGGTIPPSIDNLTSLTRFNIAFTKVKGTIPPSLCSLINLKFLGFWDLGLSGTIPDLLNDLTNLEELWAGRNKLSGTIPDSLDGLTSLTGLAFARCAITGTIPPFMDNLIALKKLYFEHTQLSGTLTPYFGNLVSLVVLTTSTTALSGTLSSVLGKLVSLETLVSNHAQFSGTLPSEFDGLTSLMTLNFETCKLSGTLPPSLAGCTSLRELRPYGSPMSGTLPPSFSGLTSLTMLSLGECMLSGTILPNLFGDLTALEYVIACSTQLSGTMPPSVNSLINLKFLWLFATHLSGTLPSKLDGLAALGKLTLDRTHLSGTIPLGVGNLTSLGRFTQYATQLSGTLPPSFDGLAALGDGELELYDTHLSGTLPRGLCAETLNFHGCALVGNGSAGLAGCGKLRFLDLSSNSLTVLPTSLPEGLTHLYLRSNPMRATAAELRVMIRGAPALAAIDVAFLALPVELSSTWVTRPVDCRLGRGPPRCAFVLQFYDDDGRAVKVGGLLPNLTLGVGGVRAEMQDLGDGRYEAVVPTVWAPNMTSSLIINFFHDGAEFEPCLDASGMTANMRGYSDTLLRTVAYGPAVCTAGTGTIPDPATGAACVCALGYVRTMNSSATGLTCHKACGNNTIGAACNGCPTGFYHQAGACRKCHPYAICAGGVLDSATAAPCPPGRQPDAAGERCQECPAGKASGGMAVCAACGANQETAAGGTHCGCSEGYYNRSQLQPTCYGKGENLRDPSETPVPDGVTCAPCADLSCVACKGNIVNILPGFALSQTVKTMHSAAGTLHRDAVEGSVAVFACPLKNACTGTGQINGSRFLSGCGRGYEGPLCALCVDGMVKSGLVCIDCADVAGSTTTVATIAIGALVLLAGVVVCFSSSNDETGLGDHAQEVVHGDLLGILTISGKIMIGLMQIVTELPVTLNLVYPRVFTSILESVRVLVGDVFEIFRIDCVAPVSLYAKFVMIMLLPAVGTTVAQAVRCTANARAGDSSAPAEQREARRLKNREDANYRSYFVIFLLYPLLSHTVFHMFACQRLYDGELWHIDDFSVDCTSAEYTTFYAIAWVFVFLYPIGIPVGLFVMLWRDKQRTASKASATPLPSLDFARKDYKKEYYYFECVLLLEKLLLTGLLVFAGRGSVFQAVGGCFIAVVFLSLHMLALPNAERLNNLLRAFAEIQLFIMLLVSIALRSNLGKDVLSEDGYGAILVAGFFLAPSVWVSVTAWQLYQFHTQRRLKRKLSHEAGRVPAAEPSAEQGPAPNPMAALATEPDVADQIERLPAGGTHDIDAGVDVGADLHAEDSVEARRRP
jgi:Leucine-rich repeat (LRR) protein